ncbi:MAG: hypothetical protein EA344_11490 [Alkalicoccus sp.]|nr:MAG: hypothetical protein EA344_11490 [Alkalicoccus sp.]
MAVMIGELETRKLFYMYRLEEKIGNLAEKFARTLTEVPLYRFVGLFLSDEEVQRAGAERTILENAVARMKMKRVEFAAGKKLKNKTVKKTNEMLSARLGKEARIKDLSFYLNTSEEEILETMEPYEQSKKLKRFFILEESR